MFAALVLAIVFAAALLVGAAHSQAQVPEGWEPPSQLPYREISQPPAGTATVGAMLVIHGGGWKGDDPAYVISERPVAERFAQQGWLVWNVDYRSSENSYGDVLMWYRMLADSVDMPICAWGDSAGGHLALLLAAREHVDCVISEGGPTDLRGDMPGWTEWLDGWVEDAFGSARWENSPLRYAVEQPSAYAVSDILLAHAADDLIVPVQSSTDFASALPDRTELHVMRKGPAYFVHRNVNQAELDAEREAERRLLTRTANPGSVELRDGALSVVAAPGAASLLRIEDAGDSLLISDPAGLEPAGGCTAIDASRISCDSATVSAVAVEAGDRADTVSGTTELPLAVAGGEGADRLAGGSGDDQLQGGAGDDALVAGPGADRMSGGQGGDIADYSARDSALALTLDDQANDGQAGEGDDIGGDVEWLIGGGASDRMVGSDDPEGFWGQAGDDSIDGGSGADWLNGGPGTDIADYGTRSTALNLTLDGQANDGAAGEADAIGTDFEWLVGGAANDRMVGSADAEAFWAQGGNDSVDGGSGADWLNGGPGTDIADYGTRSTALNLTLDGQANDGQSGERDAIGNDFEWLVGGAANDRMVGGNAAEAFWGQGGSDIVIGGGGADWLNGGAGADSLEGQGGQDKLRGGAGNDVARTRDLLADDVGCDSGQDKVVGDVLDLVLGDCELLDLL